MLKCAHPKVLGACWGLIYRRSTPRGDSILRNELHVPALTILIDMDWIWDLDGFGEGEEERSRKWADEQ